MRGCMGDRKSYAKPVRLGEVMSGESVCEVIASDQAYAGLNLIGKPKPGETVVVAAASGPVGSLVGQLAKLSGARAVGIAGGAEKCAFVKDDLRFDAAVDHRAPD